jgi:hypothetical protein
MTDDDDEYEGLDDLVASIIDKGKSGLVPKNPRGMNARSQWLIKKIKPIVEAAAPITGRGVGYKMFVSGLIRSMSEMKKVYYLLKEAREQGIIPWGWIVDETRELERTPSWNNPTEFAEAAARQYRRDFWKQQPLRCEVWSEKGTIRGVLQLVLERYGVGFRVMHGYGSATAVNDIATVYDDARPLMALYVGDFDPSGLHMSEEDLPDRLTRYGGDHVQVKRIALTQEQLAGHEMMGVPLPSFPAWDKRKDPRYDWFVFDHGNRCWEIDALDPNELRDCVEASIKTCILNLDAWERCEQVNKAERDSLRHVLTNWGNSGEWRDE